MQQDLEFEIADNSNLVKKGPIHPNRPNQNRTQKNQPHRKRNQQKKPRNDHRNSDKNDIRSPKVNSNGERRRRGGGPARGKQNRHMNKGENDPRTQPGHPSYKSHPVQEQRPLSSPSPIHQQPDPRQMQQSHSPQPGSAVQQQQPTPAIVNPQAMGANAGYGYPLMHQNLQAHQAHLIPSYPPTQSHIPPAAGFVTPNAVPQAQNVLFQTFPTMQAHQLVHQQMFPYQQLQASGMPQQSHMQPPSNGGYASSVSSYGSPGPSPAQLSSLQQSGGDEIAAVREKYEREIQALQEQMGVLRLENQALKQLVTNYKASLESHSQQVFQMQQQQMQQQQMQQQQRMQMQMQNQQLMQMQPQMQSQPQMHPQPIQQANQPNQI